MITLMGLNGLLENKLAIENGSLKIQQYPNNCSLYVISHLLGPFEEAGKVRIENYKKRLKALIITNISLRIMVTLNDGQVELNEPILLQNYFKKMYVDDCIHFYIHEKPKDWKWIKELKKRYELTKAKETANLK